MSKSTLQQKLALSSSFVKPSKAHYNRFISQCQGVYCENIEEKLASLLTKLIERASSEALFPKYDSLELGLAYGLKKKLIIASPELEDPRYSDVLFTEAGFDLILELKAKTCVFSGKRIR